MSPKTIYMIVGTACTIIDLVFIPLFFKKGKSGRLMGLASAFSAWTTISYILSISLKELALVRAFTSIYFISVLLVTFTFMLSCIRDLKYDRMKSTLYMKIGLLVLVVLDIVFNVINIFTDFNLGYMEMPPGGFTNYSYVMRPLYYYHLALSYFNLVGAMTLIVYQGTKVPSIYKPKYFVPVIGVSIAVFLNGVFLLLNRNTNVSNVDVSIAIYPVVIGLLYYGKYLYSKSGMVSLFKAQLFNSIDQGFIIFDIEKRLVFANEKVKEYFPKIKYDEELTLDDFLVDSSIKGQEDIGSEDKTFQFYIKSSKAIFPYIAHFKVLRTDKNVPIGTVFTFNEIRDDVDVLTGFEEIESFVKYSDDNEEEFILKSSVGVIDINGLGLINSSRGWSEGDRLIKSLADELRKAFPEDSYFIRGEEASLIVITFQKSARYIKYNFKNIAKSFDAYLQYCTSEVDGSMPLRQVLSETYKGMRVKKLLDNSSTHSSTISSLIKALEECDPDTQSHVKRTQKLGEKLGESLGLNYLEQSKLSLLCLLHDIGKIGIPLVVLNKPGKLTEQEYELVKTHVTKGYEIAMSSDELSSIADMIKSHHERWDGNGYPDGLKGDAIPVLSRVISIIDAYDAMVSDRSYRKGMDKAKALSEIERCAGSQFDPYISKKFIRLIMKMEGIQNITSFEEETKLSPKKTVEFDNVKKVGYTKYVLDEMERIIEIDDNFQMVTGFAKEDVIGTGFTQMNLIPLEDRYEYENHVREELSVGDTVYFEHRIRTKDGSLANTLCLGKTYYDPLSHERRSDIYLTRADGFIPSSIRNSSDIDEMDAMTGLCTRKRFTDRCEARMKKGKFKFALLILNIRNFSAYNQMYGTKKGDEVLQDISSKVRSFSFTRGFTSRLEGAKLALGLFYDKRLEDDDIASRIQSFIDALTVSLITQKDYPRFDISYAITDDTQMTIDKMIEKVINK